MEFKRYRTPVWITSYQADRLNDTVCDLFLSGAERDACAAIGRVIALEQMSLVESISEEPPSARRVQLYRLPTGAFVTVWWQSRYGTSVGLTTRAAWDQAAVGFEGDAGILWRAFASDR